MAKYKIEIVETTTYEFDFPSGFKLAEQVEAMLTEIQDSGATDYSWRVGNIKRMGGN